MVKLLIGGLLALAVVGAAACRVQNAAAGQRDGELIASSTTNIRGIVLGCVLYANDNEGELPESFEALGPYVDESFLLNPRQPNRKPGYVYIRPAEPYHKLQNIEELILVYEAYDEWGDGINVGFADGHVEFIKDEERFKEFLAASKAAVTPEEKDVREGVPAKVLAALDELEKLGKTIKDLKGKLRLEKLETLVDDITIKEGLIYYQRKKDEIRFRISFEKTIYDRRRFDEPEHFVFSDGWLTHRQERSKREDRYPVTRPDQPSSDLMRIGKSPLPIPIGQKTEEILKNFDVCLIEPNEKIDPPDIETVHLKLVPKKGTELAVSRRRLEFWLREKDKLVVRSQWENDSGDIFTADISDLQVNQKLKDRDFRLGRLPREYELKINPPPEEWEEN